MKTLYSILGVSPDATADQIEVAYAEWLAKLQEDGGTHPEADKRIRLLAIKEAYSVLSDPISRQRYNNKLFASGSVGATGSSQFAADRPADSGGILKLIIVGGILLAGLGVYSYNAQQREKLRIEHEREIRLKALRIEEERELRIAEDQAARLARQKQIDEEARERSQRYEHERYMKEVDAKQRTLAREEEARMQREKNERQRQAREEEMRRSREKAEAERRVAREKMILQQIERERYGRVITR